MTVDVEAGGALATAGLVAKAVDGDPGARAGATQHTCANCNAALMGAYCHVCGQTAHVHRSIWHLFEETLHGVLHFDSKSWRTLPLLIARPGLLTRRYIEGQRVRYVSPLALFLFMIFLMFFVVSTATNWNINLKNSSPEQQREARAELVTAVEEAKAEVTRQSAVLAQATNPAARAQAEENLQSAREDVRIASAVLSLFDKASTRGSDSNAAPVTQEDLQAITGLNVDTKNRELPAALKDLAKDPEFAFYRLKNTAYKFAFMLIPISLPFLWLMFFWRRDVKMYDHVIFSLYSLSFMSLLFVVMALLSATEFTSRFIGALFLVPPVHMFLQLRGTYRLGAFSALWRTLALLASAGTVFILFLALVAAISFG